VTDQKTLEAQLAHQAFHDALTGLANRALFRDRVDHALARSARHGVQPAVMFLDLDNFKSVNDGLGHSVGDELLSIIAARLAAIMRPSDTCARLGGDEFAILIEEASAGTIASTTAHVAERVIAACRRPCSIGGIEIVATVSVGIAVAGDDESAEDLLRNADVAMYRAKSQGKGRYEVFEPAMHELVRMRLELETELRRAVDLSQRVDPADAPFILHFQPIASLRTGEIRSAGSLESSGAWSDLAAGLHSDRRGDGARHPARLVDFARGVRARECVAARRAEWPGREHDRGNGQSVGATTDAAGAGP
jgi:diguanylate cyclase (GGDEF)-like protein